MLFTLKKRYANSDISWLTDSESMLLLLRSTPIADMFTVVSLPYLHHCWLTAPGPCDI